MSTKTFTSHKLTWIDCLAYDRRLKPLDKLIGLAIAQHVNSGTSQAYVSDETIGDKVGGVSVRSVIRSRHRLRKTRWLTWRRSRAANYYELDHSNVNGILDMVAASRDARRERNRQSRGTTPVSYLACSDVTAATRQDVTPESDIHLRGTPLSKRVAKGRGKLRVEASGPKLAAVGGGRVRFQLVEPSSRR